MNALKKFFDRPALAISVVAVVALVIGGFFYFTATTLPPYKYATAAIGTVPGDITLSGTVAPSEEIDLAFLKSGTVSTVPVHVGQYVTAGTLLAGLTSQDSLGMVNQAKGAYEAAQANYTKVVNGASSPDVAVSQAAVTAAEQNLANLYATIPDASVSGYTKANDAVRTQVAPLFSNAETPQPTLTFQTSNSQQATNVISLRPSISSELNAWQSELGNINTSSTPDALASTLKKNLAHLLAVQNLLAATSMALDGNINLSASQLASYKASVTAAQNEVNTAVSSFNTLTQNIASQQALVAQAQAQLALKQSPARPEDLQAAQAQMDSAEGMYQAAQGSYNNNFISAPINGTITFVNIKAGENAAPNQTIVGMVSRGTFEIDAYVNQDYLSRLNLGATSTVSFSSIPDQAFVARIVDTDTGAAVAQTRAQYKVVFELDVNDPRITSGLTGTITLSGPSKENVLSIPLTALIQKDGQHYVLVKRGSKLVQVPVGVGLVGTDSVEITSGLQTGDIVALVNA